jgi:cyclohexyl-isocyanide hydratase
VEYLHIGMLIYPGLDQMDFTGPFEVFARLPDAAVHVLWKDTQPLRDDKGLILTPDTTLDGAPPLHLLHVPGGYGQEALMDDEEVLVFLRAHVALGRTLFSVCTGALICGAAGILRGRRATTHWTVFDLLPYFGAIAVDERVVVDGNLVCAAGVTSGIDGALRVVAMLRGEETAREIQLAMQYAPEPPFDSGTPGAARPETLQAVAARGIPMREARLATARRVSSRIGR